MRKSTKFFSALAVSGMLAASGSAFTAGNTVAASDAGSGTTPISGFVTTDIKYTANSTNPEVLDAVTFTLNKAATYVAVQTYDGGAWFQSTTGSKCTQTAAVDGETWICNTSGGTETVAAANNLTVVATN